MKTALITTTINIPTVLELYRQHGPDVRFFVTGDKKTPQAAYDFCDAIPNCVAGRETSQIGWKCSELIGWNSIQRRNIALLEAVKWGADVIYSCDDDNTPLDHLHFLHIMQALSLPTPFNGIKVSGLGGWFDVGTLLEPYASHRGFPFDHRADLWRADPVTGARIGVAAGIILGNPDISSTTRIEKAPDVHRVSELLRAGIVVDNRTWTVFNSQATAFTRELAPAFFMWPGVGRMDDIYASLLMQKIMQHKNLHVHFGRPFMHQQRNDHNLIKDLRGEIDGMENVEKIAAYLDELDLSSQPTVIGQLRGVFQGLNFREMIPPRTVEAALAFLDDIESLL